VRGQARAVLRAVREHGYRLAEIMPPPVVASTGRTLPASREEAKEIAARLWRLSMRQACDQARHNIRRAAYDRAMVARGEQECIDRGLLSREEEVGRFLYRWAAEIESEFSSLKVGAGKLYAQASVRLADFRRATQTSGGVGSTRVANSYGWRVKSHTLYAGIPSLGHMPERIGGVLTAVVPGRPEAGARWWERSRGISIRPVDGWVIDGMHVPSSARVRDYDAAVREAERIRRRADAEIRGECSAALEGVWVGTEDSRRAGNCDAGTRSFSLWVRRALRAVGEVGALRADELLAMARRRGVEGEARRAIMAAAKRYAPPDQGGATGTAS